ncbi:MAG: hypothetical protein K2H12_02735, partial [Acetatifactor sp.]|nr:hypothetical protein [Acetatifactor sp.]
MGEKWAIYLRQIQEQAGFYGWYLLMAAGVTLVLCLISGLVLRRNILCKDRPEGRGSVMGVWHAAIAVLILTGLLMQVKAIVGFLFEDENQFFFQVRYMAVVLPALLISVRSHKKMATWLYLCIIPGCMSVLAVLFVTNMDTNTTYAKAFIGVLGSLLIIYQYGREIMDSLWKKIFQVLPYALGGMLLAGVLVCRLLLIRVSGCQPITIRAALEKMESGAEKGIYVLADTANLWNNNYRELENVIDEEDRVLY